MVPCKGGRVGCTTPDCKWCRVQFQEQSLIHNGRMLEVSKPPNEKKRRSNPVLFWTTARSAGAPLHTSLLEPNQFLPHPPALWLRTGIRCDACGFCASDAAGVCHGMASACASSHAPCPQIATHSRAATPHALAASVSSNFRSSISRRGSSRTRHDALLAPTSKAWVREQVRKLPTK